MRLNYTDKALQKAYFLVFLLISKSQLLFSLLGHNCKLKCHSKADNNVSSVNVTKAFHRVIVTIYFNFGFRFIPIFS